MHTGMSKASVLVFAILNVAHAQVVTLVNTIPTGNLAAQPPALTGAAPLLGGGGLVIADAFPMELTATLDQITVAVQYVPLPNGLGTSPMLLTILSDNNNSPGAPIETWTVPFSPAETNLTLITVTSVTHAVLNAGQLYWVSVVPTDPTTTGIGWGLVAASPNSPGLPIATSSLGTNSGWGPTNTSFANEFSVTGTTVTVVIPFAFAVENSASYGSSVAPGSIFVVYGSNLAAGPVVQANTLPLPLTLNGASITVTSGSTTVSCPMVYAGSDTVAAVLPSSVPPGKAMMTVSYNGTATLYPTQFDVAPTAPGLYTLGSSGEGPGVFTALDGSVKSFEATAKTGEIVTLWATGLGPAAGPANALPPSFPNFPGVEVFVGTEAATVIYAGRSGCCVGLDQISFVVPDGVQGCYVPVTVQSGSPPQSAFGNFVSLAVSSGGGPCSDTAPTLPVGIMNQATAGQPVTVAALAAGPVSVLTGIGLRCKSLPRAETLHATARQGVGGGRGEAAPRATESQSARLPEADDEVRGVMEGVESVSQGRGPSRGDAQSGRRCCRVGPVQFAGCRGRGSWRSISQPGNVHEPAIHLGEQICGRTRCGRFTGPFGTGRVIYDGANKNRRVPDAIRKRAERPRPPTRLLHRHGQRRERRECVQREIERRRQRSVDQQGGYLHGRPEPAADRHLDRRHESRLRSRRRLRRREHRGRVGFRVFGRRQQRVFHDPCLRSVDHACRVRRDVY